MENEYSLEGRLIDDGRSVSFYHAEMVKKLFRRWMGIPLEVTIRPLRRKRSDKQNRYMHGVIVPTIIAFFLETTGIKHSPGSIYIWCRTTLLEEEPVVSIIDGREVIEFTGKRFSQMNTKEFTDAIETIRIKMDEKGCNIPEPNGHNLLTDFIDKRDI